MSAPHNFSLFDVFVPKIFTWWKFHKVLTKITLHSFFRHSEILHYCSSPIQFSTDSERSSVIAASLTVAFLHVWNDITKWLYVHTCTVQTSKNICPVITAQCTLVHMRGLGIACRLSVRLSVTLVICDHIGWKSWKLTARTISPTPSLFVAKRRSTYSQGNIGKFWGD